MTTLSLFYKIITPPEATEEKEFTSPKTTPPLNILFLHGYFASHTNMLGVIGYFKAQFAGQNVRFYLIDLRNHGASPHSFEMNYPVMAADIEALVLLEGLTRCVLIGHSMGGKVAMTLAMRGIISIEKLIIGDIAPAAYLEPTIEKYVKKLYDMDLSIFTSREEVDQHLTASIPNPTLRAFFLKNIRTQGHNPRQPHSEASKEPMEETPKTTESPESPVETVMPTPPALAALYWQCNLPILYEALPRIKQSVPREYMAPHPPASNHSLQTLPVLFIRGEKSSYLAKTAQTSIPMYFSNYTVTTLRDTGHWLHFEAPAQFAQITYQFIIA